MSYKSTVQEIRSAALQALNGSGRFDHGRHADVSQKFEGDYPFINLYPIDISPSDDFIDTNNILIGFYKQDRPDTSTVERENIIADMDTLCTIFMNILRNNDLVQVTNERREPIYHVYQGHLSGFAVQFTYRNFSKC